MQATGEKAETGEIARVLKWVAEGRIVRPRASGKPNIIDLIHAIAGICGAKDIDGSPQSAEVAEKIGWHDHILFVLIDGLGSQLLRDLSRHGRGFLLSHSTGDIESVYPTTTSVALTSLGTGAYPAEHGIPGWWTYFENYNLSAELLPFVERFSKKPLAEFGVRSEDVFKTPSLLPRFVHEAHVITRSYIANSTYSRYWSGGCASTGYERIVDGVDQTLDRLRRASIPSYTHLYLPQLDEMCHRHGVDHQDVQQLFDLLDAEMERLHNGISGRARMVISADHGHANRQLDCHLLHDDPMLNLLKSPPSGEPSVPIFHVQPGQKQAFREAFTQAFGELFALISVDDVEELGLLGPGKLSPETRQRFGDFVGIPPAPHTIHYINPHVKTHIHRGVHAGLTPAEMWVPLILA